MARKHQLRKQRVGTVINVASRKQETDIIKALLLVEEYIKQRFDGNISIGHQRQWYLKNIVEELAQYYPDVQFHYHLDIEDLRVGAIR